VGQSKDGFSSWKTGRPWFANKVYPPTWFEYRVLHKVLIGIDGADYGTYELAAVHYEGDKDNARVMFYSPAEGEYEAESVEELQRQMELISEAFKKPPLILRNGVIV